MDTPSNTRISLLQARKTMQNELIKSQHVLDALDAALVIFDNECKFWEKRLEQQDKYINSLYALGENITANQKLHLASANKVRDYIVVKINGMKL